MAYDRLRKTTSMKPEVSKIFDDLEAYHDWCRFELCDFNPAHLYDRSNPLYRAYLDSQRPRRQWNGDRKPRGDYNRSGNNRRHNENFSN